jgi:class 3 adenylate cyclase
MDALAQSADVLGKQKLAYDLWGDTVNTGNRIESHGLIGRLQCTEQVVAALADRCEFEERGEIAVRGKASLKVWFLLGRKPALSLAAPHEAGSGQRGR